MIAALATLCGRQLMFLWCAHSPRHDHQRHRRIHGRLILD
jgi:hypothetical protein